MYKLLKLNLARNSFRYIIRSYGIKKIHLPYYLCNVMRLSALKEKCEPVFYHIDDDFMPVCDFSEGEYILYPNYFGICGKNVEILAAKYPKLIVDNAHSFYSEPIGFACFNSARKFLNVYNGSYLQIQKADLSFEYETDEKSYPKTEFEKIKNENDFDKTDIKFIRTDFPVDFKVIQERKNLFLEYHEKYRRNNLLNINTEFVISPFCYPYLAENFRQADLLSKELQKNGLTIYRYWNYLPKNYNEYKFYERLVPIPLNN